MQTIQFKVDNNYIEMVINLLNSLNSLKLNVIKDVSIINTSYKVDKSSDFSIHEINAFANHSANLIEDWKDEGEDEIWK